MTQNGINMATERKMFDQRFLKCPNCGKVITLWSKRRRKQGHIKTMSCYYCGQFVEMVELDKYGIDPDKQEND